MALTDGSIIVGIFERSEQAERALEALRATGFDDNQLGSAFPGDGASGGGVLEPGDTKAGAGAVAGAVTGGVAGALAGAAGALLIPGVGPILAGGILIGAISAASGGLLGGVIGLGIPKDEARYYEQAFRDGHSLVLVRTDDRQDEARTALMGAGARFARPQDSPFADESEDRPDLQGAG